MAEILLGGKKLVDLKVTELKAELDKRGLPKKGVKSVLLTRLKNAILREELAQDQEEEEVDMEDIGGVDTSKTHSSTVDVTVEKEEMTIAEGSDDLDVVGTEELDPAPLIGSDHSFMAEISDVPPVQLLDEGSEDMVMSDEEDLLNDSHEDNAPLATTPTNEADQGHMSGAEEAPPITNPTPAVVPSPDDSAKEVTEQEVGVGGHNEDGIELDTDTVGNEDNGMEPDQAANQEEKYIDVEGDGGQPPERHESVTIDPSYNPNGEELLYEGDVEAEGPLPKALEKEASTSQDEGFIVSVHETGMELDMSEALSDTKAETSTENKNASRSSRHSAVEGGAKSGKATPSSKSATSSESKISSTPSKTDRCSLWVSGLVSSVRAMDLQTLFSPFGQVISAKVMAKSRTKQLRFGFITMSTAEEAERCIRELDGTELKGKKIVVELAKSQPPIHKVTIRSKGSSGSPSSNGRSQSGGGGSGSGKQAGNSSKVVTTTKGGRRDEGKSGSNKSIADKIVERSRRSVEVRKVSTSDRGNRRKSAPMPRRSRSHSRERGTRVGHKPRLHSRSPPHGHISVHNRLGAVPSRGAGHPEIIRRELERDLYLRDRERQVEMRLQERRLEHNRQEINLRRQLEVERSRREHDIARRAQEARERENREREVRERQLAEQERIFKEKERELREREYRERQRREALERELREREAREVQLREREKRMKDMHDKEMRERELHAIKEREIRERETRMQADRERELRDRERRIKEEQERIERERRVHEEQQRWIREETARVARVKEEAVRLEREREEAERRERERRQREEKEKREEELRAAKREREREQKREEMEKRMQNQSGSGRLGKRPSYQDSNSYDIKRPALSSEDYMGPSPSVFHRLEPQKGRSGPPSGTSGGQSSPLIQAKDLPHVNPDIITAATQALENIRKSVPTVPLSSHLPSSRASNSTSSLQAQIQQLAAATALANSGGRVGVSGSGLDFRGAGLGPFTSNLLRPSMVGGQGGVGMMSKSQHGGLGVGKLPPEDQRYNRRLGGGGSGGRTTMGYRGGRQGMYKGRV